MLKRVPKIYGKFLVLIENIDLNKLHIFIESHQSQLGGPGSKIKIILKDIEGER